MKKILIHLKAEIVLGYSGFDTSSKNRNKLIREIIKNKVYELPATIFDEKAIIQIKLDLDKSYEKNTGKYTLAVLLIETELKITPPVVTSEGKSIRLTGKEGFLGEIIGYDFKLLIFKLLISMNIAYPGSITFSKLTISANKTEVWNYENLWGDSISLMGEEKMKLLKNLNLRQVWIWILSAPGTELDISKDQLAKALTLLQYICFSMNGVELYNVVANITWATVALETLYLNTANREDSKTKELVNRITAFLALREENSEITAKSIKDMYDYRSRFIHGDQEIIHPLHSWEGDEFPTYYENLDKSTETAIVIILATMQKLCKLGWNSLDFDMKYIPKNNT